jgi:hypothetical protein
LLNGSKDVWISRAAADIAAHHLTYIIGSFGGTFGDQSNR